MEDSPRKIFLTKRIALCWAGESFPCLTREYSFYPVRIIFQLGDQDDMLQAKWGSIFLHSKIRSLKKNPWNTILHSLIYHIKPKSAQTVGVVLAHHVSSTNFVVKDRVLKTRSLISCILLKTWEPKVHCRFPFPFLFWNYRGFQWGHCTAIWIIDFNWFNLVLKWTKMQTLSLSGGSNRGAWSSTHL